MTQANFRDLLRRKVAFHDAILKAVLTGNVSHYVDVITDVVPEILLIEERLLDSPPVESAATSPLHGIKDTDMEAPDSSVMDDVQNKVRDILERVWQTRSDHLFADSKDHERINSLLQKADAQGYAKKVVKTIKSDSKLFRRGMACRDLGRDDLAWVFWYPLYIRHVKNSLEEDYLGTPTDLKQVGDMYKAEIPDVDKSEMFDTMLEYLIAFGREDGQYQNLFEALQTVYLKQKQPK
jgi:hypothetical protein